MSSSDSPKIRRDGWTRERRLRFLDTLLRTGSVSAAAACAGMSRESAYRLRLRKSGAGFAADWNRALESQRRIKRASRSNASVGQFFAEIGRRSRTEDYRFHCQARKF